MAAFALAGWAQTVPPETMATGDYTYTLSWGGLTRSYVVHVPPAYNCREALPVVLVMHAAGGSASQSINNYRMSPVADRNGFLVVYPNGTGVQILGTGLYTWNAGYCCGPALDNNVDDMGFLSALLDDLPNQFKVDVNRIYAAGISNGGMMAHRLGAQMSDRIAAIGVVSGSIGGVSSKGVPFEIPPPSRPVPVMIFHGKQDDVIAYFGGPTPSSLDAGRVDKSVADAVNFWAGMDACSNRTTDTLAGGNITHDMFGGCQANTEVQLYSIEDGTHSWPGARKPNVLQELPNQQISADELMWKFFAVHPLKPVPPVLAPISLPYIDPNGIANAASYDAGTVSPGEVLTLFGSGLANATFWFDEAAAKVLYASDTQATVVTPVEVAGKSCVAVQAQTDHKGAAVTVPVALSGPGVFVVDFSGQGPGAILNQDGSVNSTAAPAAKGSVVAMWATGGGMTDPPLTDGETVGMPAPRLIEPVSVFIDGEPADVLYAGPAPGLIAGAMQVNVRVPGGTHSGVVHVLVAVGPMLSQFDVTMVVQ
jgi:polyhydroxybutyrate depolymerase